MENGPVGPRRNFSTVEFVADHFQVSICLDATQTAP